MVVLSSVLWILNIMLVSCSMPGCMFPVSRSYGPAVFRDCVLKFRRHRRLHLPEEGAPRFIAAGDLDRRP